MSYADLGQKVKQKYPGQYDDLPDESLGQKVAAKYPGTYDDIVGTAQAAASPSTSNKKGIIEKIGNFFGMTNFAKGGAQAIAANGATGKQTDKAIQANLQSTQEVIKRSGELLRQGKRKEAQALLKSLDAINQGVPQSTEEAITGGEGYVKPGQVYGSAAATALNALSGGSLSNGGRLGAVAAKSQAVRNVLGGETLAGKTGLTPTLFRTAGKVAGGTVRGAASGAATAAANDQSIAEGALQGGKAGALTQGVLSTAEGAAAGAKRLSSAVGKEIYGRLVNTPVRQTIAGKENIAEGLMKRGVTGSYSTMIQKVEEQLGKQKGSIAKVLSEGGNTAVDLKPTVDELQKLKATLAATPGESTTAVDSVLNDLYKQFPKLKKGTDTTVSAPVAQDLKQKLQKAVNTAFLSQNSTGVTQAQKTAARSIMQSIEEKLPAIKDPNKQVEFLIRAKDQLMRKAESSPSKLRLFAEIGLAGYGTMQTTEDKKVSPLLAIVLAERGLTTPAVATRLGQGAFKLSKVELNKAITRLLANQATLRAGATASGRSQIEPTR